MTDAPNNTILTISCPVCGQAEIAHWFVGYGHDVLRCTCGFVFARPRDGAPVANYSGDYFEAFIQRDEKGATIDSYRKLIGRLVAVSPGPRLLDAGCGAGALAAEFKSSGWNVKAVDGSATGIRHAVTHFGIDAEVVDLNTCEFPRATFDAVTSFHVIEHLQEPRRFIEQCSNALVTGGILYLGLPVFPRSHVRLHQFAFHIGVANHPYDFGLPDHVSFFDKKTIRKLLEATGLKILEVWPSARITLADTIENIRQAGGRRAMLAKPLSSVRLPLGMVGYHAHLNILAVKDGLGVLSSPIA